MTKALQSLVNTVKSGGEVKDEWAKTLQYGDPSLMTKNLSVLIKKDETREHAMRLALTYGVPNLGSTVWSVYKKSDKSKLTKDACLLLLKDGDAKWESELVERFLSLSSEHSEFEPIALALSEHMPSYTTLSRLLEHAVKNTPVPADEEEAQKQEALKEAIHDRVAAIFAALWAESSVKIPAVKHHLDTVISEPVQKLRPKFKTKGADYTRHLSAFNNSLLRSQGLLALSGAIGKQGVVLGTLPDAILKGNYTLTFRVMMTEGTKGVIGFGNDKGLFGAHVVEGNWAIKTGDDTFKGKVPFKFDQWHEFSFEVRDESIEGTTLYDRKAKISCDKTPMLDEAQLNGEFKYIHAAVENGLLVFGGFEISYK